MRNKVFLLLIGTGFVLRLGLMPTAVHSDLLYVHYFPSFFSQKGVWDVYGYFGDHYLSHGYTYYPPLVYYLVGFGQWILSPFTGGFGLFMNQVHELMFNFSSAPLEEYLRLVDRWNLMRFIFFMKLPYLLADGGILFFAGFAGESSKFHPGIIHQAGCLQDGEKTK